MVTFAYTRGNKFERNGVSCEPLRTDFPFFREGSVSYFWDGLSATAQAKWER